MDSNQPNKKDQDRAKISPDTHLAILDVSILGVRRFIIGNFVLNPIGVFVRWLGRKPIQEPHENPYINAFGGIAIAFLASCLFLIVLTPLLFLIYLVSSGNLSPRTSLWINIMLILVFTIPEAILGYTCYWASARKKGLKTSAWHIFQSSLIVGTIIVLFYVVLLGIIRTFA